jgi:hypothetical protein
MQERPRFQQIDSLAKSLLEEAERLRKKVRGTPLGMERDRLTRRARLAEKRMAFLARLAGLQMEDMRERMEKLRSDAGMPNDPGPSHRAKGARA